MPKTKMGWDGARRLMSWLLTATVLTALTAGSAWAAAEGAPHLDGAQMNLRGTFSELSRSYDPATLDHNRLYEEELAHERFLRARDALHAFLKEKLKKD